MRPLLFASILIMLASVAAPSLVTRYLERPQTEESAAATTAAAVEVEAGAPFGRSVAIAAESDGHFYIDAEINFRPVRMMVDTGATVVALRQSDAEAVGIRLHRADFAHPVQTANGATHAAEAMLDAIAVADIEIDGVRALVLPDDQLSVSLLGGSFLNRLERYEMRSETLIFEN
jgi:aspartyl protease family protein